MLREPLPAKEIMRSKAGETERFPVGLGVTVAGPVKGKTNFWHGVPEVWVAKLSSRNNLDGISATLSMRVHGG
jgi:hypothetical protein